MDNEEIKQTHSQFFETLKSRGHDLTFQTRGNKIRLSEYGETLYQNMIVMSPKADGTDTPI